MLQILERKTGLTLRPSGQPKFALDSQSRPEEKTILQYYDRTLTEQPHDRQKINVRMPFTSTLEHLEKIRWL
jgi:hypothetical protein